MAKKPNDTESIQLPQINDSETAIATWYNPVNQHHYLVTIKFDPVLKVSTTVSLEDFGPSKDESVSRFKILAGMLDYVG